jgi:DNA-binding response OmpR family regulator
MNELDIDKNRLIAIVEDDDLVAGTLIQILREFGYHIERCRTAADLGRLLKVRTPDLCIIDLGLPDADGVDLVRKLKETEDFGILIVTGRGAVTDRVLGLEVGADDYMVKPFEPRELIARVRSVLRRHGTARPSSSNVSVGRHATFGSWHFLPATLTLEGKDGTLQKLSTAEGRLLNYLLDNPNRILTREQLAGNRGIPAFDRSIDVSISRLRKRLRDDPNQPTMIKTVYGGGYLLAGNVEWHDSTGK